MLVIARLAIAAIVWGASLRLIWLGLGLVHKTGFRVVGWVVREFSIFGSVLSGGFAIMLSFAAVFEDAVEPVVKVAATFGGVLGLVGIGCLLFVRNASKRFAGPIEFDLQYISRIAWAASLVGVLLFLLAALRILLSPHG